MFPFGQFHDLNKYLKPSAYKSDQFVFRLHCVFTAVFLIACSLLLTTTQLVGEPIQCYQDPGISVKIINTFCWLNSTYTLPDLNNKIVGVEVLAPGVGAGPETQQRNYFKYYQWVWIVLFLQALLCYLPKGIWEWNEDGLFAKLAEGLTKFCEYKKEKKDTLASYFLEYRRMHKGYAAIYWCCEALCLVNVLVQMWAMNKFLGGLFWNYGFDVIKHSFQDQNERVDPMIIMFPRLTKCVFNKYGASGTVETIDSLCVLPLNIVNEKIYIFLWFWYIILATMLGFVVLTRFIVSFCPSLRPRLLNARCHSVATSAVNLVTQRMDFGDWWLLYLLAKNVDPVLYRDFITKLAKQLEEKHKLDIDEKNWH